MAESTFPSSPIGSPLLKAGRSVRSQRDFAVLRQEIESKNSSIRREIRAVASQLDRLRSVGDSSAASPASSSSPSRKISFDLPSRGGLTDSSEPSPSDAAGSYRALSAVASELAAVSAPGRGETMTKDPTTSLVMELQTKIEEQRLELEQARATLSTARYELEEVKAAQQAEAFELKSLRQEIADRDQKQLENPAHRVDALMGTVEEQRLELDQVNAQLSARAVELAKLERELAKCGKARAQENTKSQQQLGDLQETIKEQHGELAGIRAQLAASEGLKAQLLAQNAELQDKSNEMSPQIQKQIEDQHGELAGMQAQIAARNAELQDRQLEVASLKDQLFEKDLELKKTQDPKLQSMGSPSQDKYQQLENFSEAQRLSISTLRGQLEESEARLACKLELNQAEQSKIEELESALEDIRVELATTKAQLSTRNLEMTKLEAQLVTRNVELTKYEEQRAELASVKAQLMARDLKLMKQEVAMALTDSNTSTQTTEPAEACNEKEETLKARVAQLEAEANASAEMRKRLEDDLRKRDELLSRMPRRSLEALTDDVGEPLAEQLAFLAADVLSRNEQLAERQLARAKAFLEVLRGAAWAREATPSSFKLGKFLDDVANSLEPAAKKALTSLGSKSPATGSRDVSKRKGLSNFSSSPPLSSEPVRLPSGGASSLVAPSTGQAMLPRATGAQDDSATAWKPTNFRKSDLRSKPLRTSSLVVASSPQNAPSATAATGTIPASNGSLSVARRIASIENHDRTTEAILSSLQTSSSQTFLNSSSNGASVPAVGSPSIYSVPDREEALRNSRNFQQPSVKT